MKKLSDFKKESVSNLDIIKGGNQSGKGEFVHTSFRFFNLLVNDAFYDENNNGVVDGEESKSFSMAYIKP